MSDEPDVTPDERCWPLDDIMGVGDISHALGLASPGNVTNWAKRYPSTFPPPLIVRRMGNLYSLREIKEWKRLRDLGVVLPG